MKGHCNAPSRRMERRQTPRSKPPPAVAALRARLAPGLSARLSARRLLRHLPPGGPRLAKTDRNRLLAARDRAARTPARQRPGLALLHRALDRALRLLRILACLARHYFSPPGTNSIVCCNDSNRRPARRFQSAACTGV